MADSKKMFCEVYPELANEWYAPYNNLMDLFPDKVRETSDEWVYWQCPKCKSIYRMSPRNRAEKKRNGKESCFTCRGRVQHHTFTI